MSLERTKISELTEVIPTDAILSTVIAPWNTTISANIRTSMIENIRNFKKKS